MNYARKPIRYWKRVKEYSWGCPYCKFNTFEFDVLWIHGTAVHSVKFGDRWADDYPIYDLKEKD